MVPTNSISDLRTGQGVPNGKAAAASPLIDDNDRLSQFLFQLKSHGTQR